MIHHSYLQQQASRSSCPSKRHDPQKLKHTNIITDANPATLFRISIQNTFSRPKSAENLIVINVANRTAQDATVAVITPTMKLTR